MLDFFFHHIILHASTSETKYRFEFCLLHFSVAEPDWLSCVCQWYRITILPERIRPCGVCNFKPSAQQNLNIMTSIRYPIMCRNMFEFLASNPQSRKKRTFFPLLFWIVVLLNLEFQRSYAAQLSPPLHSKTRTQQSRSALDWTHQIQTGNKSI